MKRRFLFVLLSLALLAGAGCSGAPGSDYGVKDGASGYAAAADALRHGKLELAQQLIDEALANEPAVESRPGLELLASEVLLARGRNLEAMESLERFAEAHSTNPAGVPETETNLRWLVNLAEVLSKLNRADEASSALDLVERSPLATAPLDPVFKGRLLRAQLLSRARHFDEAEDMLGAIVAEAAEAGAPFFEAAALLNLSFSEIQRGRYDASLEYSHPALEAGLKAEAGQIVALANNNLGIAYMRLGDLERAEMYQNDSLAQLREMGDLYNLEDALAEYGNLRLEVGESAEAIRAFEEAVDIARDIGSYRDAAIWAGNLALAHISQRNWEAAEARNREAYELFALLKDGPEPLLLQFNQAEIAAGRGESREAQRLLTDLLERATDPYLSWMAHALLGSLLAEQQQFAAANAQYETALTVIEDFRARLDRTEYQLTFHDRESRFFEDYVDLLVSQGEIEHALQVVEYSRARVLAEQLGLRPETIGEVRPARFRQYAAQNRTALLSYWLAPRRSFVWLIDGAGIRMEELPGREQIASAIGVYRRMLEEDLRDPVEAALPQGSELTRMLLAPIAERLSATQAIEETQRVIVVADRELHLLNLETLPAPGPSPGRYWIEDVEIAIAPSLGVLTRTRSAASDSPSGAPSLLLVGAPEPAGEEFPALAGAREEIDSIGRSFPAQAQLIRTGSEATPAAFLGAMPGRYSMIHFAAHAEANPQSPMESAVILSPDRGGFKLYARDIAALELHADLVTISACRSAGERSYGGEGLVGFTWAFLQSGARSVIAGLWDVGDGSSSQLMEKLYQGLAKGLTPAAALRQAKLQLLGSAGTMRKPFYWAPYQTYIR